ncbi:MAG: IS110 family transposase, partial [Marivirga sp.]
SLNVFYNHLFERQKIKMKSYVAVQRKLLVLIYTLWKKEERYKDKFLLEQPREAALTELDQVRS